MWGSKKPEQSKPVVPQSGNPISPAANPASQEAAMNPTDNRPLPATDRGVARLGPSLHVKGEISGNEDLHVDGSIEGLISLEDRKLTVGSSSKVTADVVAREIVVFGTVKGNLRARDRIEIKKDGSVIGDLTTARIMIEDGAYFKGSIEIDRAAETAGAAEKSYARASTAVASGNSAPTPTKTT
jgi:cytoskeletal protein CcmA (bactofilin family)